MTFLWREPTQWHGHEYSHEEVNTLFRMIARHATVAYEPVCVCDDPKGIDGHIRTVPLWDDLGALGLCYRRLKLYSEDMRRLIGPRFLMLDLDTVIVGNIDHLLEREGDIVLYRGPSKAARYNGAMVLMDAGCRSRVWTRFPGSIPKTRWQGSDQAWVSHVLGTEATFGPEHGVYFHRNYEGQENACIVHLTGSADPRIPPWSDMEWIRKHYN